VAARRKRKVAKTPETRKKVIASRKKPQAPREKPPAGWKSFSEVFGRKSTKKIKQGKVGKKKAGARERVPRARRQEKVKRGRVGVPPEVRRTPRENVSERLGVKEETVKRWEKEGAPKQWRRRLEKEAERLEKKRRREGNRSAKEKLQEALKNLIESDDDDKAKAYIRWKKIKKVVQAGMTREEWVRLMREIGTKLGLPAKGKGSWTSYRDS